MALINFRKEPQERDFFSAALFSTPAPKVISEDAAMKIPAVRASVEAISNSIAMLPVYLYYDEDQNIKQIEDSRVNRLNHEMNSFQTAQAIKKLLVRDYLLNGKAYLYKKNGELHYLHAEKITANVYTEDSITPSKFEYIYRRSDKEVILEPDKLVIIESGTNGILIDGGDILKQAEAQIEYSKSLLTNSAVPTGALQASSRLTQNAIDRLRQSFENLYSGSKRAGRTIILEEGLEFKPIQMKPADLQLTESGKQMISEIARLFNIPESMINSSANKYNSLEQNGVYFLQNTLAPIITAIETAFDKYLLNSLEKKNGWYFRFETSEILRTTEKEKLEVTAEALNKGLISYNQAAYRLDLPPEEVDYKILSTGTVLKFKDGTYEYPNLGPQNKDQEVNELNEDGATKQSD